MRDKEVYLKIQQIIEIRRKLLSAKESSLAKEKFLHMFEYCLNSMKEEYLRILQNSYFSKCYKFWWMDYYCQSSYYRKRLVAITSFVSLFEMIYENFNDISTFANTF